MATFYGELEGNRGVVTRTGSKNSGISASLQSFEGSLTTTLYYDKEDNLCARVSFAADISAGIHSWNNSVIFDGPVKEYVAKLKK